MNYAGIDLSLTGTGIVIGPDSTVCKLVGRTGVTNLSIVEQAEVLASLVNEILMPLDDYGVGLVVIEGLDMAQSYGGQIERTVLWWAVVLNLHLSGQRVFVAPSGQVKIYATGAGNADKGAVVEAVTRQWPQFETRGNNNLADAAAMCALACELGGSPLSPVSDKQRRALSGVREITQPPPPKKTKARRA